MNQDPQSMRTAHSPRLETGAKPTEPSPATAVAEAPVVSDGTVSSSPAVSWIATAVALFAAFFWSYLTTLADMAVQWGKNPDYTHGYLVAPLAVFFLWLRRDEFPHCVWRLSWLGIPLIAGTLCLRWLGTMFFVKSVEGWSILLWCAGAAALLGGWPLLRFCAPSIAFLGFMVPLPYRASHWLSGPLQRAATEISCWTLQCLGQPALAEGHTILLGEHHLEVQQACSGLRIFMGILAIAAAYIIGTRRTWWEQLLLLCSALPIALVANSARIVVTGLLYQYVSDAVGKQFSHDFSGWVMIPFAAALFAVVLWYLDRLVPNSPTAGIGDLVARQRIYNGTGAAPHG